MRSVHYTSHGQEQRPRCLFAPREETPLDLFANLARMPNSHSCDGLWVGGLSIGHSAQELGGSSRQTRFGAKVFCG